MSQAEREAAARRAAEADLAQQDRDARLADAVEIMQAVEEDEVAEVCADSIGVSFFWTPSF